MRRLHRTPSFWLLAAVLAAVVGASAVVTPLYTIYQDNWGFSDVVLTSVFAIYALTLLVTLLTIGSLSDRVGRRPVLAIGLAFEIGAMLFFLVADGAGWLYLGRALQGVATALVLSTVTAVLIDLEHEEGPEASVVNSYAPMVGLAVGAAGAGALVQWGPSPLHLVFWILVGVFALSLAVVAAVPETVPKTGRWLESLAPRIGIPEGTGGAFLAVLPGFAATWSLGGLYFSLGPGIAHDVLGNGGHLAGGLVITAFASVGAISAYACRGWNSEVMTIRGMQGFALGVSLTVLSLLVHSTPLFFAATMVAGFGFGPGFLGAFRTLTDLAPEDRRAEMVSAIFIVSYLSFSLPAIAAGAAVTQFGLEATAEVYGCAAVVLALSAAFATAARREPAAS
jgi:MFS family permease